MTTMPRVLVIDDDEPLRSVLCRALERVGYEALEAADGQAALEVLRLQEDRVDVIVTDIVMPDMEGIELIMWLRKAHPSLPVIAMSGGGRWSSDGYLQIARGAGAASVLAKPFEMQALLSTVKALVSSPATPA